MKTLRSGVLGIMAAILSGVIVLSILSLGLAEGMLSLPQIPTIQLTLPPPNLTPVQVAQVTTTPFPSETFSAAPTQCPQPIGWQPYLVQPGDTLANLAQLHGISLELLMAENCLISSQVVTNTWIYLPANMTQLPQFTSTSRPSPSNTSTSCSHPSGWVLYTVRPGDTLTQISEIFRVSVLQLMQANCLVNDEIRAGSQLWVPNVPTSTLPASPTNTPIVIRTTRVPTVTPTYTPTITLVPTITFTPEPTSTFTLEPTSTLEPTNTTTPEPTFTNTPEPTATKTPKK